MAVADKAITFNVTALTAPAWWSALADATGTTIATAAGKRLSDVATSPPSVLSDLSGGAVSDILADWTSMAVNQATGELMMAGHGGHSSWAGNEGFLLAARDAVPGWKLISASTPVFNGSAQVYTTPEIGNNSTWPAGNRGRWKDGRPTAMHCTSEVYANGRIWYCGANSYSNQAGDGTADYNPAYNLNFPALVAARAANTTLAWTASNTGPWEIWPPFAGMNFGTMSFGTGVYDPVTQTVWFLGAKGEFTIYAVAMNVANVSYPGTPPTYTVYQWTPSFNTGEFASWVAIAPDLRLLIAADSYDIAAQGRPNVSVMDLSNPGAWTKMNTIGTPYWGPFSGNLASGAGAFYVQANNSLCIGHQANQPQAITKLAIPTKIVSGNRVYDPAGTGAFSQLPWPGGPNSANSNCYRHWNTVEDMGDGRQGIFVSDEVNAVHVYKIPAAGLGAHTTAFPANENPVSEGGRWTNAGTSVGTGWHPVQTTGGVACASTFSTAAADDCIAIISGLNPARHRARATIRRVAGYAPVNGHECELIVGASMTSNAIDAYETLWAANASSCVLVKWHGPMSGSSFMQLAVSSTVSPLVEGDEIWTDLIVVNGNPVITCYCRGVLVLTYTDTGGSFNGGPSVPGYTNGKPGMSFFARSGATLNSYGFKSFTAVDNI